MRFFAFIVLVAVCIQVLPARAQMPVPRPALEDQVRKVIAECTYWQQQNYEINIAIWAARIEAGQWTLEGLAKWGLDTVIYQRAGQLRATMPNGKPDRAARRAAGQEIKRMHDLCNVRQYRGR